jgi:hypothetical protein
MTHLKEFAAYVKSFYGPSGIYADYFGHSLTDFEIALGIGMYIERLRHVSNMTWGGGDSWDREQVRDIMLSMRKVK